MRRRLPGTARPRPPLTSGCISARTAGTWNRSISSIMVAAGLGLGRSGEGRKEGGREGGRREAPQAPKDAAARRDCCLIAATARRRGDSAAPLPGPAAAAPPLNCIFMNGRDPCHLSRCPDARLPAAPAPPPLGRTIPSPGGSGGTWRRVGEGGEWWNRQGRRRSASGLAARRFRRVAMVAAVNFRPGGREERPVAGSLSGSCHAAQGGRQAPAGKGLSRAGRRSRAAPRSCVTAPW